MRPERNRDRSCFRSIAADIFVLLKISVEAKLFDNDQHHDDTDTQCDDRGIKYRTAVIDSILNTVRIQGGKEVLEKDRCGDDSATRQAGTEHIAREIADRGSEESDDQEREELQAVGGKESTGQRRDRDPQPPLVRNDAEKQATEEEFLDNDRQQDGDDKDQRTSLEGVL